MDAIPETRFAVGDGGHIAYQDTGGGGPVLVYAAHAATPIDLLWDDPLVAYGLGRLSQRRRLLLTELRGAGSSDAMNVDALPPLETWAGDIGTVLDAAEVERAALFATSELTLPSLLFAATHPDRVSALVLANPFVRFLRGPDTPWGLPEARAADAVIAYRDISGRGPLVDLLSPSRAHDPAFRRWATRAERLGAGPSTIAALWEVFLRTDALGVLPSVQAPTLVIVRTGARHIRPQHGRQIAERIPGARLVELDGEDTHWFSGDVDTLLDHIEAFLEGGDTGRSASRALATVLFSDIVDSTRRAAEMGDGAWRELLRRYAELASSHVAAFGGRIVKSTGDGTLATFDGPARAVQCARHLVSAADGIGLALRAGIHTGEVEVIGDDVGGLAVHIGARVSALAEPRTVLVSAAVPPLVVGSGIRFTELGTHRLKGVPEPWTVYAVEDRTLGGEDSNPQ